MQCFSPKKALYAVTKKCKLVKRIFQLRIFLFDSGIMCFKEYQAFHFEWKLTIYTNMAVFMNVICSDKYIFMNHCELDKRLNVVFSIKIFFEGVALNKPQ